MLVDCQVVSRFSKADCGPTDHPITVKKLIDRDLKHLPVTKAAFTYTLFF